MHTDCNFAGPVTAQLMGGSPVGIATASAHVTGGMSASQAHSQAIGGLSNSGRSVG